MRYLDPRTPPLERKLVAPGKPVWICAAVGFAVVMLSVAAGL